MHPAVTAGPRVLLTGRAKAFAQTQTRLTKEAVCSANLLDVATVATFLCARFPWLANAFRRRITYAPVPPVRARFHAAAARVFAIARLPGCADIALLVDLPVAVVVDVVVAFFVSGHRWCVAECPAALLAISLPPMTTDKTGTAIATFACRTDAFIIFALRGAFGARRTTIGVVDALYTCPTLTIVHATKSVGTIRIFFAGCPHRVPAESLDAELDPVTIDVFGAYVQICHHILGTSGQA